MLNVSNIMLCTIYVTELVGLLQHMSIPAQGAAAAAIRMGIFAWLEEAPVEFVKLAGGDPSVYLPGGSHRAPGISRGMNAGPGNDPASQIGPQQAITERIEDADRLLDLMAALAKSYSNLESEKGIRNSDRFVAGDVAVEQMAATCGLLWTAIGVLFCVCSDRVRDAQVGNMVSCLPLYFVFSSGRK